MLTSKYKLLVAVMLLGDLVLLLVWMLRDTDVPATPMLRLEAESASASSETSAAERSPSRPSLDATRRSVAPISRRARAPIDSSTSVRIQGSVFDVHDRTLIATPVEITARDEVGGSIRTHTRPTGNYVLDDLHAGRWKFFARAEGYHSWRATYELRPEAPPERLDIVLVSLDELRIRLLTPTGESLAAALDAAGIKVDIECVATREDPRRAVAKEVMQGLASHAVRWYRPPASHGDAVKGFGSDVQGVLTLQEPLPAYVSLVVGDRVLQTKLVLEGEEEVAFVLAADEVRGGLASLRLTVVDSQTGAHIAKARVTLEQSTSMSDENGVVEFEQVPPGLRRVEVRATGYETARRDVDIAPGRVNDGGLWPIDAVVTIRGRFVDASGEPVRMTWSLTLAERDPSRPPRFDTRTRSTDGAASNRAKPTGVIYADDLGRGKYWIRTHGQGKYAAPTLVDASRGPVKDLVIRVSDAVAVRFRFPVGEDTYVATRITDSASAPVAELSTKSDSLDVNLGPGTYTIRYRIDDNDEKTKSFEVGTTPIEVRCER